MASIKLYKNDNNNLWLDVTYTSGAGYITIEKIVGECNSGYGYSGRAGASMSHQVIIPGGSGFITTNTGVIGNPYSGTWDPEVGVGYRYGGYTWGFEDTTIYGSGTGTISIIINDNGGSSYFRGTYVSSEITISSPVTNPTIKTIQANSTYNSITASVSIDKNGGANITFFSLTCNGNSFSNTDGSDISGIFTELIPNTEYKIEATAKNSSGLSSTVEKTITTSNIEPLKLKNFTINTSSNNELVLNYTLPDFSPTINKLFGRIQINGQQTRGFESTRPEVRWRESSPGAENNPCFVFDINDEKSITLTSLKNKEGEVIELKEGDNIQVWLLTGVDYEDKEYFVNESWVSVSKTYQAAPWIFISPFGKKAEKSADYEEVEMIIMDSGYKTKIQSSKSETEVTVE